MLSAGLRVDHENKTAEPMTWAADFVISSYLAADQQGEQGAWQIVSDAHVIDIVTKVIDSGKREARGPTTTRARSRAHFSRVRRPTSP
ncbi:MAG: hypothetical protein ACRDUV_10975 [Pseudonocardiaceae bacterium]